MYDFEKKDMVETSSFGSKLIVRMKEYAITLCVYDTDKYDDFAE